MKPFYLILFIVFPSILFAQTNYHTGYILKANGDTLKGYINYQEWTQSPRSIDFKVNKDDKQKLEFNPVTIKGFQINGMETYVAFTGMISMNRTSLSDISEKLDTVKKLDTIFLKQVATGKYLTLYAQSDEVKTRFFISESNTIPIELKNYEYYNEYKQIVSSPIYKGQLLLYINKYVPGNSKLTDRVGQAHYDQPNLMPLVDKINNNGVAVKRVSSNRLYAGIAINSTITEVHDVNYTGITQHYTTIAPKINFGVDIFDNPNVQRFVFRGEVSFSYAGPRYKYPVTVSGTNTNEEYSFDQYTASLTPQILINLYNKDDFKVYIDAGIAFNFSTYSNNKYTIQSSDASVVNANTIQKPYKLEPYYSNFPLQAGVTLNRKIEIYFTRIGYAAYTKYTSFYASNQTMSLGVKFLFSRN